MAHHQSIEAVGAVEEPVAVHRKRKDDAEMDITPMIDIVFLLLIFFLVAATPDQNTAVELPPARHGGGVSVQTAVIFTLANRGNDEPAAVYAAEGAVGDPLPDDPEAQKRAIISAVEEGFNEGKIAVLVKAERSVKHKDVSRVADAVGAAEVEDVHLHIAVFEKD